MYLHIVICVHSSEDFSDDVEEDDVGSETTIVSGIQGECKKIGEGKYRYAQLFTYLEFYHDWYYLCC